MKLLPEPGWLRTTCLNLITSFSTFVVTSLFFTYLATEHPKVVLEINYKIRFTYLAITKKVVFEKIVNGNSIYFYSDNFNGKRIEIANEIYLYPVLKEAYEDFENFVTDSHKLKKPGKKQRQRIKIIFVRPEIYRARDLARQEPKSSAFADIFVRNIYIESGSGKFDVLEGKSILRHEIFHVLSGEYTLYDLLSHYDAYDFGALR